MFHLYCDHLHRLFKSIFTFQTMHPTIHILLLLLNKRTLCYWENNQFQIVNWNIRTPISHMYLSVYWNLPVATVTVPIKVTQEPEEHVPEWFIPVVVAMCVLVPVLIIVSTVTLFYHMYKKRYIFITKIVYKLKKFEEDCK